MVVISSCFTFINTIFSSTAYVGSRLKKRKKLCREQALSCFIPTKILSNSNAQPKADRGLAPNKTNQLDRRVLFHAYGKQ